MGSALLLPDILALLRTGTSALSSKEEYQLANTTNTQRIDLDVEVLSHVVISPMHCLTSLEVLAELWCHQGTFSATCVCWRAQPHSFNFWLGHFSSVLSLSGRTKRTRRSLLAWFRSSPALESRCRTSWPASGLEASAAPRRPSVAPTSAEEPLPAPPTKTKGGNPPAACQEKKLIWKVKCNKRNFSYLLF